MAVPRVACRVYTPQEWSLLVCCRLTENGSGFVPLPVWLALTNTPDSDTRLVLLKREDQGKTLTCLVLLT